MGEQGKGRGGTTGHRAQLCLPDKDHSGEGGTVQPETAFRNGGEPTPKEEGGYSWHGRWFANLLCWQESLGAFATIRTQIIYSKPGDFGQEGAANLGKQLVCP